MAAKLIHAGETFLRAGQPLGTFYYVIDGSVLAEFTGGSIILEKGDIIGIGDFDKDSHFFTYTALSDCKLQAYSNPETLLKSNFFEDHPDNMVHLATTLTHILSEMYSQFDILYFSCHSLYDFLLSTYEEYKKLCNEFHIVIKELPGISTLEPMAPKQASLSWQPALYEGLHNIFSEKSFQDTLCSNHIIPGYLYHASEDLHFLLEQSKYLVDYTTEISHLLINEDRLDLFDLYTGLYFRVGMQNPKSNAISAAIGTIGIHMESQPGISKELVENRIKEYRTQLDNLKLLQEKREQDAEAVDFDGDYSLPGKLADSVGVILDYADCLEDVTINFRKYLTAYKHLSDKNSSDREVMLIRRNLADYFYKVYASAFQVSLMDEHIPTILKMFFNFGYVDAELCGMDNACFLYELADRYTGAPEQGVFTVYEWLLAIYHGERVPSINEFEVDFEKHVQSLKTDGKINDTIAERMLRDKAQKVLFELGNMFPSASKITSGRPSTFCPVLSEHQFVRTPQDSLLYYDNVLKALNGIKAIDFSLFYREAVTVISEKENIHDFFHVEITPDIILMPVVGTRGAMWQEIIGRNRLTPARMMLPIFQLENLQKSLLRMAAEYRWEMCKRIQGARWNDVTYPSLTSLYYDYLQFYRKNSEISAENKEKIKVGLQKCKQSFKEYFIFDYMTYILYESTGSPHMTKIARSILFSQCPFSANIRTALNSNPIYKEPMDKYRRVIGERIHKLDSIIKKLESKKLPVPQSVYNEIEYFKN